MLLPFVVTRDQYGSEHLTTGVMKLSFKSIRISPSSSAQQTRDLLNIIQKRSLYYTKMDQWVLQLTLDQEIHVT
jgi:hypothetical protein